MLEVMFSNDEDGEQSVGNLFLEVVEQSRSGMLVASFEDEERARIALSCHLSVDLHCQEMQVARQSDGGCASHYSTLVCQKVRHVELT